MMLDTIDQKMDKIKITAKVQESIDVFVECYTINRELKSKNYGRMWGCGEWDKDAVRSFYETKESKFRKHIKQLGMTVSIHRDFHNQDTDTIRYNFYYKGTFLYSLIIYFEGKNLNTSTYEDLTYDVYADAGQNVNMETLPKTGFVFVGRYS